MSVPLKVRIGIGLGTMTAAGTAERFAAVVDGCEELGFVAAGIPAVDDAAAEHGRAVDPQHHGALVAYCDGPVPDAVRALVERRRPDLDVRAVVPTRAGLPALLGELVDAGASKFVVVPFGGDADPAGELHELAELLLPLET